MARELFKLSDTKSATNSKGLGRTALSFFLALSLMSSSEIKGCDEDVTLFDGVGVKSTSSSSSDDFDSSDNESSSSSSFSFSSSASSIFPTQSSSSSPVSSQSSSSSTLSSTSSLQVEPISFKSAIESPSTSSKASGPDSDKDGLLDVEEKEHGTSILNPDSDYDGYTDLYEIRLRTNPLDSSSHPLQPVAVQNLLASESFRYGRRDKDGDGLPDSVEDEIGTRSDLADTDGDNQNDGAEAVNGTDPLIKNEAPIDSDGDGISDEVEASLGTNPLVADSDGDSLNDLFEILFNSDPKNPDTDGDGVIDGWDPSSGTYRYSDARILFPEWK